MTDWLEVLTPEERNLVLGYELAGGEITGYGRRNYKTIQRLAEEVGRLKDRNAFLQYELDKADPLDPAKLRYLEHEEKIARFWRNAILREKCSSGNPMRIHVSRPDVREEHFPIWLGLFHEVLQAELPERTALQWGALADRIGEGFRTGIVAMRQPKNAPPKLF